MTREEKCKLAIEMGYTYNPETGKIYSRFGREITGKFNTGYIKINNNKFELVGHQFAWYWVNKEIVEQIDHINGIRDDNRICNLRSVTHQKNQWNATKAKGYTWNKRVNKWKSQITINNKKIYLGYYDDENDARQAYLKAKEQYHII
jgi:hypothetical protein